MERNFDVIDTGTGRPIKAWTRGVLFEEQAAQQLKNLSTLPFVYRHVAVMPDVHSGIGATVGSVIPTRGAIIPAAVGVDIGCGMMAVRTSLKSDDLPDDLHKVRVAIERAVPHGFAPGRGRDTGSWGSPPANIEGAWSPLDPAYRRILEKHPALDRGRPVEQMGTLGAGNHFIEICLDQDQCVWFMLHSGSRGVGNRIGSYFIELARQDMKNWFIDLPDRDLAYFPEGTSHFSDYVEAVSWAQMYAMENRRTMMTNLISALSRVEGIPAFKADLEAVNCHHNYVATETHFGEEIFVTRKGAVRAGAGEMGIIPGSMGARSFIVRGKGNPESFMSCSHGAGRTMSRTEARKRFTLADHAEATRGVECRKDANVIDETPAAYKPIDAVMKAQEDLVEVVHTLKQIICVKG